jgi:hypothetical protein
VSEPATLRWLAALQERFGAALRQPLDRSAGSLRARSEDYPDALVGDVAGGPGTAARDRLAVYHRQYWFRLFGVMQAEYPLTARLLGPWFFNDYAGRFLSRFPPRHHDIQRIGDGFDAFFEQEIPAAGADVGGQRVLPREAAVQAVRIDAAFRRVLAAPAQASFAPGPADAAALPASRLIAAESWWLIHEDWPLLALRMEPAPTSERAEPLPAPHPERRSAAIYAGFGADAGAAPREGCGAFALEPLEARLLLALRERPVAEALAEVEQEVQDDARALLLQRAPRWLALSVQRGFWVGIVPA